MFLIHQTRGWLGLHYFKLGSKLKKQSPINPFEIKSRKKTSQSNSSSLYLKKERKTAILLQPDDQQWWHASPFWCKFSTL
jgi:hypothetical protein